MLPLCHLPRVLLRLLPPGALGGTVAATRATSGSIVPWVFSLFLWGYPAIRLPLSPGRPAARSTRPPLYVDWVYVPQLVHGVLEGRVSGLLNRRHPNGLDNLEVSYAAG